jgi:hypothetical protein
MVIFTIVFELLGFTVGLFFVGVYMNLNKALNLLDIVVGFTKFMLNLLVRLLGFKLVMSNVQVSKKIQIQKVP